MSGDIKEYLDQKGRIGKLDSLLLYLTSLFGLLFSLIQALGFGIEGVIHLIPLLFSGMFLPIYFGYIRGVIMTDSLEERIRGWLYLICSIPFYLVPQISQTISKWLETWSTKSILMEFITKELTLLISLAFSTSIGLLVSSTTSTLTDKIFDICKKQPSQATYEMVSTTYLSALGLAILLLTIASFQFTRADPWNIFTLLLIFIIFTPWTWTECKKASKWAL